MEGKLIKTEVNYILENDKGVIIASTSLKKKGLSLSIKNCEAIANGYDLDELACKEIGIDISVINHIDKKMIENSSPTTPINEAGALGAGLYHQVKGFEIGFKKALEILADKKYTETELYHAFLINSAGNNTTLRNFFEQTVLPMFNDNAWDVEICCYIGNGDKESDSFKDPIVTNTGIPKLDANGCLILRRK